MITCYSCLKLRLDLHLLLVQIFQELLLDSPRIAHRRESDRGGCGVREAFEGVVRRRQRRLRGNTVDLQVTSASRLGHWSEYCGGVGKLERGRMEKGAEGRARLGFYRPDGRCVEGRGAGRWGGSVAFLAGATTRWLALHGCAIGGAEEGKSMRGRKGKGGRQC